MCDGQKVPPRSTPSDTLKTTNVVLESRAEHRTEDGITLA
jgi:hypothetical protein